MGTAGSLCLWCDGTHAKPHTLTYNLSPFFAICLFSFPFHPPPFPSFFLPFLPFPPFLFVFVLISVRKAG